jgi:hypothetical protein
MKFPSLTSLSRSAGRTFLRFPLAIPLAIAGTVAFIVLIERNGQGDDNTTRFTNIIISCYLGMLLSIAVKIWTERQAWAGGKTLALQGSVLLLSVLYYFMMPDHFEQQIIIRWVLYALGLHWLIAVIGFMGSSRINGFWQYNKKLFLRILTSMLYTAVLGIGLQLALLAIDNLFNAGLSYKCYMYTWLILTGIFNTWFFLDGFPADYEEPAVINDYPRGLKIFTQYVLLPILTVYMLILYAYLFKIVFTAHWPSGWVAYLVLCFSVAGILALLLIYPLRNDEGNKWINGYSRFFYFALFPLLVLLGFAIYKRVKAYGITELRYFVLLLAAWLLCIAVYFLRSRKKNIQLIPLSLCLIAFLSSFGPWGVFNVSRVSQQSRLKSILTKYGLLKDGMVTDARVTVAFKDRQEISSITTYIVETHGYHPLQPMFRQNLDSLMRKDLLLRSGGQAEAVLGLMHLSYTSRYDDDKGFERLSCQLPDENVAFKTAGLPYVIPYFSLTAGSEGDSREDTYKIDTASMALSLDSANNELHLSATVVNLAPILQHLPESIGSGLHLSAEQMTLPINSADWKGQLVIQEFNGVKRDGTVHIIWLRGTLLLDRSNGKQ